MHRFLLLFALGATSILACVGDAPITDHDAGDDGGADATAPEAGDASSVDASLDVEADATRPVPTPVGDFDWKGVADGPNGGPIAYDAHGNLFFAFQIYDPITFDNKSYTSAGTYDAMLVKFDPSGKVLWVRQYGGTGSDQINGLAVDPAGDAYATFTSTSPSFSFGNSVDYARVGTGGDGFVVKVNGANGDGVWLADYTKATESYLACSNIAYGGGRLAVSCWSNLGMALTKASDSTPLTLSCLECGNPQHENIYVASLDPTNGHAFWGTVIAANASTSPWSLAVDSKGAAVMDFTSFGAVVHDPTNSVNWTYVGVPGAIALVVKLAATNGAGLWFKQFTDGTTNNNNQTAPGQLAIDSNDDVILGGQISGQVPFGTVTLKSAGGSDGFVAKLKGGFGDVIWAQTFGGTLDEHGANVGVDAWNEVFVAADCLSADAKLGTVPFPVVPSAHQGICIGKLDPTGVALWATGIVSSSTSPGLWAENAVAVDPSVGDVTVAGGYQGTVDLGDGNPYTSKAGMEANFVVTHNP